MYSGKGEYSQHMEQIFDDNSRIKCPFPSRDNLHVRGLTLHLHLGAFLWTKALFPTTASPMNLSVGPRTHTSGRPMRSMA